MKRLLFLFILAISFVIHDVDAAKVSSSNGLSASVELSNPTPYAGEIVIATLYANCFDKELAYISEVPVPKLNKGEFSLLNHIEVNERPHVIKEGNKEGIAIPVAKFAIQVENPGKIDLLFPNIKGIAQRKVVRQHPFWGYFEDYEKENVEIIPEKVSLNFKKLPENKKGIAFSGAMGDFGISVEVPRGNIVVNETADIIIVLNGVGFIPGEIIPDYEVAFGDKIKLKSIKSDAETYFDGQNICQKRIWRCEIVPNTVGECTIDEIKFGYFNTKKGEFEEIASTPVIINVKSSTIKREVINV